MSDARNNRSSKSKDHIFVKPEVTIHPKKVRGPGGPYPPTEVPHEEEEITPERQRAGIKAWLEEVVTETKKKELRDEMAYFVVDFGVRADHPSANKLLTRLQSKLLTFLDQKKTRALVASEIEALSQTVKSRKEIPPSLAKLAFNIRSMRITEQIDKRILDDETWKTKSRDVDIYVVPNVSIEKVERYVNLARKFLHDSKSEIHSVLIERFSGSGMLSVKTDFPTTSKLLQKSSFVYKVHQTPIIGIQKEIGALTHRPEKENATKNPMKRKNPTSKNLSEVCVLDTGVNLITPLAPLVSDRSSEPSMPNADDHDDHGTPVAYLVAFGEGNSPRARIISHKILSGSITSSLITALANAMRRYLHRAKIFTCSINFLYENDAVRHETRMIGRMVQASNACVLFSAGNIFPASLKRFMTQRLRYPRYLEDSPVLHPSDAICITAVGSYCKKAIPHLSIAPEDSPSPFTRFDTQNNLMHDCVKPEIVEHGGNLNTNYSHNGVGVRTFSASGSDVEKIGTSLSTPIVAGHLAEVYEKYGPRINNAETLKAIAYISCSRTQNHPKYVGFGKPNRREMLVSSLQSATIIFEGEMPLVHPHYRKSLPANKVEIYVPAGVNTIELCVVHSDNYRIPVFPGLYTYMEVVPDKPARVSAPIPDQGLLRAREHVKKLVWQRTKGVKGYWTFTLVPHHIGIPPDHRTDVQVRYGGVVKLTTTRPRRTPLVDEVRRNLRATMR